MSPNDSSNASLQPDEVRERFFTAESANDALVLVRPVVRDIVAAYNELMRLRTDQQELVLLADAHARLDELRAAIEQKVERLKRLVREIGEIGCELKDPSAGLVDFPALHDGRKVLLCWKLDEPEVAYWHEVHTGFAGRQPIDTEFRLRAGEPLPVRSE